MNITIKLSSTDITSLESKLNSQVLNRFHPCNLIIDATSLNINLNLMKSMNIIKSTLDKHREKADKLINKSEILVSSRIAIFIAKAVLKVLKPNKPTKITYKKC